MNGKQPMRNGVFSIGQFSIRVAPVVQCEPPDHVVEQAELSPVVEREPPDQVVVKAELSPVVNKPKLQVVVKAELSQ